MIDTRLLVFYKAAQRLSFSEAAQELLLTQPAVTFQIKKLEQTLGTRLFYRDKNRVTLTVFIPETQIGHVKVGQPARVTIDSVSRVFEGTVTFIAHEAEFTPKNVQTKEERVNLVFAVEITLDNPEHILKPGMPADAEILP